MEAEPSTSKGQYKKKGKSGKEYWIESEEAEVFTLSNGEVLSKVNGKSIEAVFYNYMEMYFKSL